MDNNNINIAGAITPPDTTVEIFDLVNELHDEMQELRKKAKRVEELEQALNTVKDRLISLVVGENEA